MNVRRLVAVAVLHALLGTGCGGCVDDDKTPKPQPMGSSSGGVTGVRRIHAAGAVAELLDSGAPPAAANDQ
jgi:hypothetical protein